VRSTYRGYPPKKAPYFPYIGAFFVVKISSVGKPGANRVETIDIIDSIDKKSKNL